MLRVSSATSANIVLCQQQLWPLVYFEAPPRHSSGKTEVYLPTSVFACVLYTQAWSIGSAKLSIQQLLLFRYARILGYNLSLMPRVWFYRCLWEFYKYLWEIDTSSWPIRSQYLLQLWSKKSNWTRMGWSCKVTIIGAIPTSSHVHQWVPFKHNMRTYHIYP